MNVTPQQQLSRLDNIGIVFVSPIVGITGSLIRTFRPVVDRGVAIEYVDIFDDNYEKKTFWKVIKLTILPGAHSRRIAFANSFPEHRVFDKIRNAIKKLAHEGKTKIVLGGMSGGFIFAARVIQSPPDHEIQNHDVLNFKHHVKGLFGISPLIFYPPGVIRPDIKLNLIPSHIRTLLFFCDGDDMIPIGTMKYAMTIARKLNHIRVRCLNCVEFSNKSKPIRHQFFGGRDFIGPLKNPFWHPEAEACALNLKLDFLEEISLS